MKLLAFIGVTVMLFTSCQKLKDINLFNKEKKETLCAVVSSEAIPQAVKDAFTVKYSGQTVTNWFDKDGNGFCAEFTQNGVKTLAQFNNDGAFVKEEIDNHQEGEYKDKNTDPGCSCEIESGD